MAEQCCAVPKPRHAVLCPRCAGPCYAIAVRTHATPSLCFATHCPCTSVLGRSVARRSHALEASPLPCAALPCPSRCYAEPCPRRACPRRPTPSPRIANQSCANAVRVLALASQTVALPSHCSAVLCLADAWPCWALPSLCAAPPGGALPLRRRERLSRRARCAALCRRLAGHQGALPLRSVSLQCPRKALPCQHSSEQGIAAATGA